MSLLVGPKRALLRGGKNYRDKVLATGPIAYWIQGETAGSVAYCQIRGIQNGAYTGVTLGQPGIGDGRTAPLYDGANDYTDAYSVALNAVFSGTEGTFLCWAKVSGAGVWTDGTVRRCASFRADADNLFFIQKDIANNSLTFRYEANTVAETVTQAAFSPATWFSVALSWSLTADEMRAYIDGAQVGATQTTLGTWAGVLDSARCLLGSANKTPASVWDGYLAHGALWDRALSPAEMASVGVL